MKILSLIGMCLLMCQAYAQRNPQIRVCNISGGNFWSINITQPRVDTIGFCRYGAATMGSISMIEQRFYSQQTQAVAAFLDSNDGVSSCAVAGGARINGTDSFGTVWDLCLFEDGSFVSEETLRNGYSSTLNADLRTALYTR